MFQPIGARDTFQPGCDLWLAAGVFESLFFKRLNWRTGFLLAAPGKRPPPVLLTPGPPDGACKLVLYLESAAPDACFKIWSRLQKPSLRAFLPAKEAESFLENWPEQRAAGGLPKLQAAAVS